MSVQFGRWNLDGSPTHKGAIRQAEELLLPYSPDGVTTKTLGPVTLIFGAFHTTSESNREHQPASIKNGDWVLWNGRLDNREECVAALELSGEDLTDLEIVCAVCEKRGTEGFGALIGDWAMGIWSPSSQSVTLAKDFLGTHHLYYSVEGNSLCWSSILEPLILLRQASSKICEEYVAGWLSSHPKTSLTPYRGILSVPPASWVRIRPDRIDSLRYWNFAVQQPTASTVDEYAEQFLTAFKLSINRRMRSDRTVLAELSGGMDSSSIVCTADRLIAEAKEGLPKLETLSYFSDTEPHWDDRAFFTDVEKRRGKVGRHIDLAACEPISIEPEPDQFFATPSAISFDTRFRAQLADHILAGDYRILLSGIGGDEVTGGVPNPLPELTDLLRQCNLKKFARQLLAWSIAKQEPILSLLIRSGTAFLPIPHRLAAPSWIHPHFAKRNRQAFNDRGQRFEVLGPLPSFQANILVLETLREQLACVPLPSRPTYEMRYPFLDRDFLTFCYSIPREQLLRPELRRSLLRHSMAGIVPDEVLNRKRKAFVSRRLANTFAEASVVVGRNSNSLLVADFGIIEPVEFVRALEDAATGKRPSGISLLRVVALERWLRNLLQADSAHAWQPQEQSLHFFSGREQINKKGGERYALHKTGNQ